MIPAEKKVSNW